MCEPVQARAQTQKRLAQGLVLLEREGAVGERGVGGAAGLGRFAERAAEPAPTLRTFSGGSRADSGLRA